MNQESFGWVILIYFNTKIWMESSSISKMWSHLLRNGMCFDLWSIIHKPHILNHAFQFCRIMPLLYSCFNFDLDDFAFHVLVLCLHLHRDVIYNVSEPFPHPIHQLLHSILHLRISSLFPLIRICQKGFRVILNFFARFLFLCSIEIIS